METKDTKEMKEPTKLFLTSHMDTWMLGGADFIGGLKTLYSLSKGIRTSSALCLWQEYDHDQLLEFLRSEWMENFIKFESKNTMEMIREDRGEKDNAKQSVSSRPKRQVKKCH